VGASRCKGKLISFEGPDGAGKSTQIGLLAGYLKKKGLRVLVTRQPGGTRIGTAIRSLLLDPDNKVLSERAELFLYLADRAQHVREVILPARMRADVVLVDRYMDSTWVYQGSGRGFSLKLIEACNTFSVEGNDPDLTVVLDVEASKGLARLPKYKDRMESQSLDFHKRVRAGFRSLKRRFPKRVALLDGGQSKKVVQAALRKLISTRLGL
jgi:dTMP kinase